MKSRHCSLPRKCDPMESRAVRLLAVFLVLVVLRAILFGDFA